MNKTFTEINKINKHGRVGVLNTRRGGVKTPTFMPDGTRGAVKSLTPQQVIDTGVGIVLANTYHLHLHPGEKLIKGLGGIHKFANRKGPMLTDSGGFQVFSLDKHAKVTEEGVTFKDPLSGDKHLITPETSIQIQLDIGADMIVAFDHLIGLDDASDADVKDAFDRTHRWLARCITEFKRLTKDMIGPDHPDWTARGLASSKGGVESRPLLFGVVQGGLDLQLRKESLKVIQDSNADGIAIGGLSVGETRQEMETVLRELAPLYRSDKPRFLLGVGTPEDLKIAVENGIDMLDCVLPTRNARHSAVWTSTPCACGKTSDVTSTKELGSAVRGSEIFIVCKECGEDYVSERINLSNERFKADSSPIEVGCDCYACASGFSKAFLRHQFKVGEPLAGTLASIHNLRHMMRLCEGYRSVVR